MQKTLILIPSRLSASRLPNKPLIKLNGKEMLLHVWELCNKIFDRKKAILCVTDKLQKLSKNRLNFCIVLIIII